MNANKLGRLFPRASAAFRRLNGDAGTAAAPLAPEAEAPRALRGSQGAKRPVAEATVTSVTGDHVTRAHCWTVNVEPMGAPRMTQRDKWKKRPVVLRYHEYRDRLRAVVGEVAIVPDAVHCVFWLPMPASWPKKKRQEMDGQPHRSKPDGDNALKGTLDALLPEDSGVWRGSYEKRWCWSGKERVEITFVYDP